MLQKYLLSQSKLSTIVQKPKKTIISKQKSKTSIECKESIIKSTEVVNKESGSEYFPSTDSGT